MINLVTTKGIWYDMIANNIKAFDFRKGKRDISKDDIVSFKEADTKGILTGKECFAKVNLVIHSTDFPPQFGWNGEEFTIIQFNLIDNNVGDKYAEDNKF